MLHCNIFTATYPLQHIHYNISITTYSHQHIHCTYLPPTSKNSYLSKNKLIIYQTLHPLLRHINVKLIQLKQVNKWSEEVLIRECLKKNEKAQRYLFESNQAKMFAVCMRYVDNEDEAFDILNESFLKVFNKLKHLKSNTKVEAWIRRIVVNTALDHIRKNKSYRKIFIKTEKLSHFESPNNETDDISEWWISALKIPQERFFLEINRLPKASCLVFNLFVIDDIKHKEIAKQLGISESTSRWHLSNAREILKEKVKNIINNEIVNEQQQPKRY